MFFVSWRFFYPFKDCHIENLLKELFVMLAMNDTYQARKMPE